MLNKGTFENLIYWVEASGGVGAGSAPLFTLHLYPVLRVFGSPLL